MFLNKTMRNIAMMLFSALFFSCEDPTAIGLPLGGGEYATTFTDTLTIKTSTLIVDSVRTDLAPSVMVGAVNDLTFGKSTARAFWQVALPVVTNSFGTSTYTDYKLDADMVYDSAYVYLGWNGYFQGDSTKNITLALHRLAAGLDSTKQYLNKDSAPLESTPLASRTFTFKEMKRAVTNVRDSLMKFKLPDAFGREIFGMANKYTVADKGKFMADVKGFGIVPNNDAAAVYGLTFSFGATQLFLYYHKTGETTARITTFPFSEKKFTGITTNRAGTDTDFLKTPLAATPSARTNDKVYFQSATGVSTKFEIPFLKNLTGKGRIAVNKAELILTPEENTVGFLTPVPTISLVNVGSDNRFLKKSGLNDLILFDGLSGSGSYASNYSTTDKKYTLNITGQVQDILNGKLTNNSFVIVPSLTSTASSGSTTVILANATISRAIFNAKSIKLNVYYSSQVK